MLTLRAGATLVTAGGAGEEREDPLGGLSTERGLSPLLDPPAFAGCLRSLGGLSPGIPKTDDTQDKTSRKAQEHATWEGAQYNPNNTTIQCHFFEVRGQRVVIF